MPPLKADYNEAPEMFGPRVDVSTSLEGLNAIRDPDIDLVILQRRFPVQFMAWLEQLDPSVLPKDRLLVRPEEVRVALACVMDACGMPSGEMRKTLVEDVHGLVSAFAHITRTERVDVRLERVTGDACWRFHRDCVEARLLTTYLGPTTEWVQQDFADQALREQKAYNGPLERLQPNDVALFKGSCAGPASGIVHRSPPIAGTGKTRLLLCLNKQSEVSPDPWQEGSVTGYSVFED